MFPLQTILLNLNCTNIEKLSRKYRYYLFKTPELNIVTVNKGKHSIRVEVETSELTDRVVLSNNLFISDAKQYLIHFT